jgi:hypothetical protein
MQKLLAIQINSRADAEAFIMRLCEMGLCYHFEDDPVECLTGPYTNGKTRVSAEEATAIGERVQRCYDAWRASGADMRDDCPISFAIECLGHIDGPDAEPQDTLPSQQ